MKERKEHGALSMKHRKSSATFMKRKARGEE